jgi:ATP-dependent Lhr-like helicase
VDRLRAVAAGAERALGEAVAEDLWALPHTTDVSAETSPPAFVRDPGRSGAASPARALVLAATDPANPYGAALPWPERGDATSPEPLPGNAIDGRQGALPGRRTGHRAGRKAGALVVLVDGALVLYVERGGRSLLTWSEDADRLQPAADALALAVREGALGRLTVERADGIGVLDPSLGAPLVRALADAGFSATPRGLRLRP